MGCVGLFSGVQLCTRFWTSPWWHWSLLRGSLDMRGRKMTNPPSSPKLLAKALETPHSQITDQAQMTEVAKEWGNEKHTCSHVFCSSGVFVRVGHLHFRNVPWMKALASSSFPCLKLPRLSKGRQPLWRRLNKARQPLWLGLSKARQPLWLRLIKGRPPLWLGLTKGRHPLWLGLSKGRQA